ncbi:P-loop containing nucleoside triphosphate hydrolase [Pseudocohnilembus persalinus]|uniref:p-loop containing nucleoside triphosphate hydrolase n=1 Tax=Pseudocohnilembus persalinus TaxID=266149 RepID=A0A0V0QAQ6_PSEPJ|nr:P-loop containing nucleoside triphosphate hydrolase [Pseudocohnilembus persalinus]|eukprot:KRW99324.1 P-loop containing nucleoside triphosphate hydrolase [Pseudocohnilembus persalinus]
MGNHGQWNNYSKYLKGRIQDFENQVNNAKNQHLENKTKQMFDGMNSKNYYQEKKGLFGFLQSNTQPIYKPIKDHNMDSHKKKNHIFQYQSLQNNLARHKGLYIHGDPGSGKTVLMDMFYDSVPLQEKYRVHFNEFLSQISQEMAKLQAKGITEPQRLVALKKASEIRLLCLDEFQVTDIANAMILKSLFETFIQNNVIVIATSNRPPDDLYKGGLQRDVFLPFIPFLKENCKVLTFESRDYRKMYNDGQNQNYFFPCNEETKEILLQKFEQAAGTREMVPKDIEVIKGRNLKVKKQNNGAAWFDFEELFLDIYGATDYIALCKNYHTFVLNNVPFFTLDNRDALRRFILFIEEVYNYNGKLYISGQQEFDQLFKIKGSNYKKKDILDEAFTGHDIYDEEFAFERCLSRVIEMQTQYYLDKPAMYYQIQEQKQQQQQQQQTQQQPLQQQTQNQQEPQYQEQQQI